jgi:hypothetical protein
VNSTLIWRPEPLTIRLIAAAAPAARDLAVAAAARAPSRRVATSVRASGAGENFTVGSSHPLGLMFEKGVSSHEITPKDKVLKLADGRFVSGGVRHPGMKAKPWLRPVLPLWPSLYRRQAAQVFRGF